MEDQQVYIPADFPLTGGTPLKNQDLAASIVFLTVYAFLIPIAIYRLSSPFSRCLALIRPVIFIPVRIVSFALRINTSLHGITNSILITQQVFLQCGFILLCEPVLQLTAFHLERHLPKGRARIATRYLFNGFHLVLMGGLALAIYSSSQFGDLDDPNRLQVVKSTRISAFALFCFLMSFCFLSTVASYFLLAAPVRQTFHLAAISSLLMLVTIYKIIVFSGPAPRPTYIGTKVAFYLLSCLPELVATVFLVSPNLSRMYEIDEVREGRHGGLEGVGRRRRRSGSEGDGEGEDVATKIDDDVDRESYRMDTFAGTKEVERV
ncbi:hypothetical protein T439DRAFT_376964 [Meredithblackwellia eburnea MCA 4105]